MRPRASEKLRQWMSVGTRETCDLRQLRSSVRRPRRGRCVSPRDSDDPFFDPRTVGILVELQSARGVVARAQNIRPPPGGVAISSRDSVPGENDRVDFDGRQPHLRHLDRRADLRDRLRSWPDGSRCDLHRALSLATGHGVGRNSGEYVVGGVFAPPVVRRSLSPRFSWHLSLAASSVRTIGTDTSASTTEGATQRAIGRNRPRGPE